MRILLLTHAIKVGSLSNYVKRLGMSLETMAEVDIFNNGNLYKGPNSHAEMSKDLFLKNEWRPFRTWITYKRFLRENEDFYDIIHICSQRFAFLASGPKYLVTYHDIFPFSSNESDANTFYFTNASIGEKLRHSYFRRNIVKNSLRGINIVTDSESTRCDLIRVFSYEPNLIHVIPYPLDLTFKKTKKVNARKKLGLPESVKIVLFVSSDEYRKNIGLRMRYIRDLPEKTHLINVGPLDIDLVPANVLPRIHQFESISDETLSLLYDASDLFVSASFEEGFDVPVIEAMAHGVSVLVSDIPVHREIVGNHGTFFDPRDYDDFFTKICHCLSVTEESRLEDIFCLSKFSPRNIGNELFNLYLDVISHGH